MSDEKFIEWLEKEIAYRKETIAEWEAGEMVITIKSHSSASEVKTEYFIDEYKRIIETNEKILARLKGA